MNLKTLLELAKDDSEISIDDVISAIPNKYHERVNKLNERVNAGDLLYLLATTEFYGGIECSFDVIERTVPATIEVSFNKEGEVKKDSLPNLKKFYLEQERLYKIRTTRKVQHSLTALEVCLEELYKARTGAPAFGSHRNLGFFGQGDGKTYTTS